MYKQAIHPEMSIDAKSMIIACNQFDYEENNVENERIFPQLIGEGIRAHLDPHTVTQSTD